MSGKSYNNGQIVAVKKATRAADRKPVVQAVGLQYIDRTTGQATHVGLPESAYQALPPDFVSQSIGRH